MQNYSTHQPTTPLRFNSFLSQPHQPFFFMGMVWAIVTMFIFMLNYKGILLLHLSSSIFHAYAMIFILFSHFFHGFLLTTFPRFCMTQPIPQSVYIRLFILYEVGTLLFLIGSLFFIKLIILGMLLLFAGHLFAIRHFNNIYHTSDASEKSDPFWLLITHTAGLTSHLLFITGLLCEYFNIEFIAWQPFAVTLGVYLYLIFLTFVIAQRMIPFFSHVTVQKPRHFILTVFTLLIIKIFAFTLNFSLLNIVVTLGLAAFLLKEFLRWRLPIFTSPAILWVLHLALFWLPAGLFIDAISILAEVWFETSFLFAGMHLITIGFMTTMLIGFGTRVILGHSGQAPHADQIAVMLFWLTEVVTLVRFLYSLGMGLGLNLSWLFDLSATLWIILFIGWGAKFGPILFRGKSA
jgi:uncharacterized protein involved in response to NO